MAKPAQHEPSGDFSVTPKKVTIKTPVILGLLATGIITLGGWAEGQRRDIRNDAEATRVEMSALKTHAAVQDAEFQTLKEQMNMFRTEQYFTRLDQQNWMARLGFTPPSPPPVPPATAPSSTRP